MDRIYTDESIQSISPREFTRLRPGVYCGSTEYSTQLMRELFSNALDEHIIGHGTKIYITIDKEKNIYTIQDEGQGIPVNKETEDGRTLLEDVMSVLNTSGKYSEDGVYGGSALGLNGVGAKLACYLSTSCTAISNDGKGQIEEISFADGLFQNRKVTKTKDRQTGLKVTYSPDAQFFHHVEANTSDLNKLFTDISALCPQLSIYVTIDGQKQIYHSEEGINFLVDKKSKGHEIISNRFTLKREKGDNSFDICLTYTNKYEESITPYVNYGETDSGVHITAFKSAMTRNINKFARDKKLLKSKEDNLKGDELAAGLVVVFNLKANGVSYDAQSKTRIVDIDKTLINEVMNDDFVQWLEYNEKDAKIIIEKALLARKAKEAAKKARDKVREGKKDKGLKGKMSLSDKFIDCKSKDPAKRNLLLVEGLSAGSSAIEARNVETDCIYMLRGKIISPLKTSIDKILANQEMSDIIKVIGAGFNDSFDVSKSQFDKIVITSDSDSDGDAICLLLITFFYTYMKDLVLQGKLYRAVTPLYIVKTKNEDLYFYTDNEYNEWRQSHGGNDPVIRAKGLGELSADQLHEVCFENQRFKRITVSDAEATANLLEILEGKKAEPRKQYIYDNADRLGFNFM